MNTRKGVRCIHCNSLERTRVIKLLLDLYGLPKPGMRVLHFAPERGLFQVLTQGGQVKYDPVDLEPENFGFCKVRRIDLCADADKFPSEHYDVIIHSHIAEHIMCNITAVLYHIHRALKSDGIHFMCVPFLSGYSEEDFKPLRPQAAISRFGQADHVRKFGAADVQRNLGMLFKLPQVYSLEDLIPIQLLDQHNVPSKERRGFTGSSVFPLRKRDLVLTP